MLTSLLLAACCLAAQDAPPASEAPAAAPTATPEAVRTFLTEAEANLYDPISAGLASLEFDVSIDLPQVGAIGTAHVSWSGDAGVNVAVARNEQAVLPPGFSPEMAEMTGRQMATQLLGAMLNKPITPMLDDAVAVMDGVEDGQVKVRFHIPAATEQGVQEQAMFFDDDGVLQRMRVVAEVDSPMGKMKVVQTQSFSWKPSAEGSDRLLPAGQQSVADMGVFKVTGSTSFTHATVEGILLVTSMSTTQNVPMSPEPIVQTLAATNVKVNGRAVGG